MAEHVPLPTPVPAAEEVVTTDHSLRNRVLGCFGCGGLGVAGFFGALVLLIGGLGAGTGGCEINLDGDPGKGTDSARLAVAVSPKTDLVDGATVRVTSDAFDADAIVGVAVCSSSADRQERGVDACDEVQGARYATDADGNLDATFVAPRAITVGETVVDCAEAPDRCLIVAASAGDYDQSGGQPISFRTDLPPITRRPPTTRPETDRLPIGASPALTDAAIPAGRELDLLATGFQPGEPLLVAYCTPEIDEVGMANACEPQNVSDAFHAIALRSVSGVILRANADGAVTTTVEAHSTVTPFGDDLGEALSKYGSASSTTRPPTATTTTRPGATTTVPRLGEGEVRCTRAAGGCSIVIAAAADTKRSAVLPYVVEG